jgi:hypothetical protein
MDNCIEEFLGPEICNNPIVTGSKIPPDLRDSFEIPLSIIELDESASQGNRSASGMDGISNCFIKKFWPLLRTPLHRGITHCLPNKKLNPSFRTASIKLIPKKGDTTKLKN